MGWDEPVAPPAVLLASPGASLAPAGTRLLRASLWTDRSQPARRGPPGSGRQLRASSWTRTTTLGPPRSERFELNAHEPPGMCALDKDRMAVGPSCNRFDMR